MCSFASACDILSIQWSHWAKSLVNFKVAPYNQHYNDQHMRHMHRNYTHNDIIICFNYIHCLYTELSPLSPIINSGKVEWQLKMFPGIQIFSCKLKFKVKQHVEWINFKWCVVDNTYAKQNRFKEFWLT